MRRIVAGLVLLVAVLAAAVPAQAREGVWAVAHVQNLGWGDPNPDFVGTTGQSLRLEALQLVDPVADIQGHVQNLGWGGWTQVGVVGTTGRSLRLEAIQVQGRNAKVWCQAHVQNIGWMEPVSDGQVCGTTGLSLRLEAVRLWTEGDEPATDALSTFTAVGILS